MIVVEENHSFDEVLGPSSAAPFLRSLAVRAAVFTDSHGVTHPSEPNYLALFSGSTQGVSDDSCPHTFGSGNLARSLLDAGRSFAGFSENLPSPGYQGCSAGSYARKHNPWSDFANVPADLNLPFTAWPSDFAQLPSVSFVVPDETNDMHSASVGAADEWLRQHLAGYAAWAGAHNSLLIVTADEDDFTAGNRIPTLILGAHVRAGSYAQRIDHYSILRTLEQLYGLALLGHSASATPITGCWLP